MNIKEWKAQRDELFQVWYELLIKPDKTVKEIKKVNKITNSFNANS